MFLNFARLSEFYCLLLSLYVLKTGRSLLQNRKYGTSMSRDFDLSITPILIKLINW
jgi:hypothetical protein